MQLKKSISRFLTLISQHLNTPAKINLFLSMLLWALLLRVSLVFFSLNRITPWVSASSIKRISWSSEDITRNIGWLMSLRVINTADECLAKSLLYYRFLSQVGKKPKMIIGISKNQGHAWVEVAGNVVSEPASTINEFTPVLVCNPGESSFTAVDTPTTSNEPLDPHFNV